MKKQNEDDYYEIHLDKNRIARLQLPTPLTQVEKDKIKNYIDLSVRVVCVDVISKEAGWNLQ